MTQATADNASFRDDARVISLVGIAHAVSHFFHLVLASLFPWLKEAFVLSYAELGFLMSVFFIVSGVGQALSGFVVDRVGARMVLFAGLGMLGISAFFLSAAQNYSMLLAGAMLAGLGNSVFHPADFTLLNRRVSLARLGYGFSMHGVSGNLGWAAAPIFMISVATVYGWRAALVCAALLPLAILALLLVYRRELDYPLEHKVVKQAAVAGAGPEVKPESAMAFMRLPAVWLCFTFFFISTQASGGIQSFSSPSLRSLYDMSLTWATSGVTVYMLSSALGTLWGGFLATRSTRHDRNVAIAFSLAGLISLVLASGLVNPLVAIMLMGVIGFCAGTAGPSRDLLIRAASPKHATGRVYGVVYSGMDLGMASAPILFGLLMDHHHPSWVFILIGAFQVAALFTAFGVGKVTQHQNKAA